MIENRRAVLLPDVRPLPVQLRRIVHLPEQVEQLLIGNLLWIELHFDSFGVSRGVRANFLVIRIRRVPAGVTHRRRTDALHLPERVLDAPEASRRKRSLRHSSAPSYRLGLAQIRCHVATTGLRGREGFFLGNGPRSYARCPRESEGVDERLFVRCWSKISSSMSGISNTARLCSASAFAR